MLVQERLSVGDMAVSSPGEVRKRLSRWRLFQTMFVFMYAGIILDIITTAIGFHTTGAHYEQNPLGGYLISHLGWPGLFALATGLCLVCYTSFRTVYFNMSTVWSAALNVVVFVVAASRWLIVTMAVLYLAHASI